MQTELRKIDRLELLAQPNGEIYLLVNEMRLPVSSVLNISPQGIRVQLSTPASDFSFSDYNDVVVQYQNKEVNLNVNGTIVWNMLSESPATNEGSDPTYDIGINLLGPHLLYSLMQT